MENNTTTATTITLPNDKELSMSFRAHRAKSAIMREFGEDNQLAETLADTLIAYAETTNDILRHMERQVKDMNRAIADIAERGYSVGSTTTFVASSNDHARFQANIAKNEVLLNQVFMLNAMLNIGNINEVFNFIQTGTAESF